MIDMKKVIVGTCATFALVGCASTTSTMNSGHGISQNAAIDRQVVSKTAIPGAPEMNPQMVDAAIQRYLTDTVKKVEDPGSAASD